MAVLWQHVEVLLDQVDVVKCTFLIFFEDCEEELR